MQCTHFPAPVDTDLLTCEVEFQHYPLTLSLQQWVLLVFGFLAGLIALAAAVALSVSVVEAIMYQGESLLKQCNFKNSDDADSSSSITYECPFDPTRLYVSVPNLVFSHLALEKQLFATVRFRVAPPLQLPLPPTPTKLIAQNRIHGRAANSVFVFLPEHHRYPVGSSHLHVPGGDGVLLPLLCRLLLVPLPVSMQEGTRPGQEGETTDRTTAQTVFGAFRCKW